MEMSRAGEETDKTSAPSAGSTSNSEKSESRKVSEKSRIRLELRVMLGSLATVPLARTGQAKRAPSTTGLAGVEDVAGKGGAPLTEAMSADEEGLKVISEAVRKGPTGGVVWFVNNGARLRRRLSRALSPAVGETEKQETPDRAPPLRTQTGTGVSTDQDRLWG